MESGREGLAGLAKARAAVRCPCLIGTTAASNYIISRAEAKPVREANAICSRATLGGQRAVARSISL